MQMPVDVTCGPRIVASIDEAVDRGAEDYLLMRRFPGRTYYRADPDTFYQTALESLRNASVIRDLEQAGEYVRRNGTAAHQYVLLPYREAGVVVDTGTARCRTFREVSYDVLRKRRRLEDFLPAAAVFMTDDPRRYSSLFEPMRESRDYVAGGCQFTLLFRADNGNVAVYDIRSAAD